MAANPALRLSGMLDNNGLRIPLALITQWDRHSVQVLCPYCQARHHHGVGRPPYLGQTRQSHCGGDTSQQYQLCYPFEPAAADYWYEVDKENHQFRTVGVPEEEKDDDFSSTDEDELSDGEHFSDEDEDCASHNKHSATAELRGDVMEDLSHGLSSVAISDDDRRVRPRPLEEVLKTLFKDRSKDPKWRADCFFACCYENDTRGIEQWLYRYDDPFLELKHRDGNDCIALAAMRGNIEVIRLLHGRGVPLNSSNKKGRTPLMEAALWGRLKVIDFLLNHNVDPQTRDRKGRNALSYALPSKATARMRGRFTLSIEKPQATADRRVIEIRLRAFEPRVDPVKDVVEKWGIFRHEGNQISYYDHMDSFDIPDQYKTSARLDRGRLFRDIWAASGWRTDFSYGKIIPNDLWTNRARELCLVLGYELMQDARDGAEPPGSFYASHAEKKLIAYFIDKHVILPDTVTNEVRLEGDRGGQWISDSTALRDLAEMQPWPFQKESRSV